MKAKEEIDYQIGAHDINQDTSLDGGESIQFDFENAAIFKRLADDIYESSEAGIREPLQNALTAIKTAIKEGYIDKSEGVVEINVKDGDQVQLTLKDNGIGISKDILNEVLTVIGRSQNRDDGTVSGKYGMGFLACYKLVGVNGGFIMHTNSRQTNNPPFTGVWKPGMFELDKENELPQIFDEDDYGTRFDFTLRKDITIDDVREWVQQHAEWATVPIIYREYDSNNTLEYDDEFGVKKLTDEYSDEKFSVTIDNDYYTVICSQKNKRTLLINSPISRNSSYNSSISRLNVTNPRNMDIRLKNENGVVVKGPHKGLMPVSEAEYNNMDEERRKNYISEEKLNTPTTENDVLNDNIDIKLPQPTGTRDTLEKDSYFWAYLHKKVMEKAKNKLKSYMNMVDKPEDFIKLPIEKQNYIFTAIPKLNINKASPSDLKQDIKTEINVNLSDELAKFYFNAYKDVYFVERGTNHIQAETEKGSKETTVANIISKTGTSGSVFMGVSMNKHKMNAVWESSDDNVVVRVENSDVYEQFKEFYGWKKLRYVKNHIDMNSVTENTRNYFTNGKSKSSSSLKNVDIEDREITIHKSESRKKYTLKNTYKEYYRPPIDDKTLILFLSNSEYNLSNYYNLVSENIHIANSLVKMWDYLKDNDNITTIENWIEDGKKSIFNTSDGTYTGNELQQIDKDIIFHVTDADVFSSNTVLQQMKNISNNTYVKNSQKYDELNQDNIIYVPITTEKLNKISVLFKQDNNIYTINNNSDLNFGQSLVHYKSDLYWYAWSQLPEWRESEKLKTFANSSYSITDSLINLINNLAQTNISKTKEFTNPLDSFSYKTSEGVKSLREIKKEYDIAAFHILEPKIVKLFRDKDILRELKSYVYENSNERSSKYGYYSDGKTVRTKCDIKDMIYIPISEGEFRDVKDTLSNEDVPAHVISKRTVYSRFDSKIDSNTCAYASAILSDELIDIISPEDKQNMSSLDSGGLELIETISELD